jgi:hypothetical protein
LLLSLAASSCKSTGQADGRPANDIESEQQSKLNNPCKTWPFDWWLKNKCSIVAEQDTAAAAASSASPGQPANSRPALPLPSQNPEPEKPREAAVQTQSPPRAGSRESSELRPEETTAVSLAAPASQQQPPSTRGFIMRNFDFNIFPPVISGWNSSWLISCYTIFFRIPSERSES